MFCGEGGAGLPQPRPRTPASSGPFLSSRPGPRPLWARVDPTLAVASRVRGRLEKAPRCPTPMHHVREAHLPRGAEEAFPGLGGRARRGRGAEGASAEGDRCGGEEVGPLGAASS